MTENEQHESTPNDDRTYNVPSLIDDDIRGLLTVTIPLKSDGVNGTLTRLAKFSVVVDAGTLRRMTAPQLNWHPIDPIRVPVTDEDKAGISSAILTGIENAFTEMIKAAEHMNASDEEIQDLRRHMNEIRGLFKQSETALDYESLAGLVDSMFERGSEYVRAADRVRESANA